MNCQTTEIISTENIQLGVSQCFFRGRSSSASGLILPSPEKKSLQTSQERILLHHSAVQFSTGYPVQFSTGIYICQNMSIRSVSIITGKTSAADHISPEYGQDLRLLHNACQPVEL